MVIPADSSTSTRHRSFLSFVLRLNLARLVMAALVTLFSAMISHASPGASYGAETARRDASMRISAGGSHICHVKEDGSVRCWGKNHTGQLGNGVTGGVEPNPVAVTGLTLGVAISGGLTGCALLSEGSVACWGDNRFGQLGTATLASERNFPANVNGGGGGFSARDVAAGRNHTCAVRANGTIVRTP